MEEAVVVRPLRIGWNIPGTFSRLGLHMGVILAWIWYGFPLPSLVVATSAGAIIAACCISFDGKTLKRVRELVENLKPGHIYRLSDDLKKAGIFIMSGPSALVLFFLVAKAFDGWMSWLVFCAGVATATGLVRRGVYTFLRSESPFDNAPLREMLMREEVAQNAFRAPTELRVVAADVEEPGCIVYSNHEPRMCDPENPLHCQQFLDGGILGSSALPGRFPLRVVRGKTPRDGEVWTDYPINQFKGAVDVVFRLDYWPPLMPGQAPRNWLADLFRSFDVIRDKNTREKMARYERERRDDPRLPRVVCIRASKRLVAQIPDLAIYNFKPGQLRRSIALGMRIIRENRALIQSELGLLESTREATPAAGEVT